MMHQWFDKFCKLDMGLLQVSGCMIENNLVLRTSLARVAFLRGSSCAMCTNACMSLDNPHNLTTLADVCCASNSYIKTLLRNSSSRRIACVCCIHMTLPHGLGTVTKCTFFAPLHLSGVCVGAWLWLVRGCKPYYTAST